MVGDFIDNYELGYPSEFGMLTLMDARTGVPRAVIDATAITDMRTGAMTAVGAKYLAPSEPKVLGHMVSAAAPSGTSNSLIIFSISLRKFEFIPGVLRVGTVSAKCLSDELGNLSL